MRKVTVLLLLGVMLAGCSDDASKATEQEDDVSFDDEDIVVTEETGAIRGIVVDDAIQPIEGVLVTIPGSEAITGDEPYTDTTDAQGRFSFSDIEPATYFLEASSEFHQDGQATATVVAGVADPPITKIQLVRLYSGDPFKITIPNEGFFTCSQSAAPPYWYSSSSCHDNNLGGLAGGLTCIVQCLPVPSTDGSDYDIELEQKRTFHQDIDDAWQTMLFEMKWQPSAQGTSDRMGIVVSDQKEQRPGCHSFANDSQTSPMYLRVNLGEDGPGARGAPDESCPDVPKQMPAEGWDQMSYFMSVRPPASATCPLDLWCAPPGLALDQDFEVWLTVSYYRPLPDGWSFLEDGDPFA